MVASAQAAPLHPAARISLFPIDESRNRFQEKLMAAVLAWYEADRKAVEASVDKTLKVYERKAMAQMRDSALETVRREAMVLLGYAAPKTSEQKRKVRR